MLGVAGARRCTRGLVLVSSAVLCVGLAAPSAWAAKGVVSVFGRSGAGDGQFANAYATAVNANSGDAFVVDQGDNRVEQFDASGGFVRAWGWGVQDGSTAFQACSSGCQPGQAGAGDGQFDGPQGIAIDQSDGSVYVVDGNNNRVEKFDSSGTYVSQFGSAGSAEGQLSGPQGIAVDPSDSSIYVADAGNNRVQKFESSTSFVDTFGFGVSDGNNAFETCTSNCLAGLAVGDDGGFSGPTRVAVDSVGQVYVLDSGNGRIERYTSANAFDQVFDPTDVFAPQEIAVGPGNDHLYLAQWAQDFSEQRVVEIDGTGTLVDTHGIGSTANNSSGLALSAGSEKIYLADGFNARVLVLDDVTAPTVSVDPAGSVTSTGASLSGSVTPNGSPSVGWHFETSTDDANWSAVAADEDAGNGNSVVPVAQNLTALVPNTTYFVRLVGTRPFNAPAISSEVQFTTPAVAPGVTTDPANDLAPGHATLQGRLNAHHAPTTYYFEYGPTTSYGASFPVTQDADGGSAEGVVGVARRINGLQSGTTYHYRLVATNQVGAVNGADDVFTTTTTPASNVRAGVPGTGFLPDDRGWEQVSPPVKNGGDVMGDSARTRAARTETPALPMAVSYGSLSGFGDVQGTGVAADYMGVRTAQAGTNGWATHAITPRQDPGTFLTGLQGADPLWEGEFSPDLTSGVFRAWSPLTDAPLVAQTENLYTRHDLRTAGTGSYQLQSACPACATPLPAFSSTAQIPRLAGASSDLAHVIFESIFALTPGANPGASNVYEYVNGNIRLAGILPDSACGTPPCPAASSVAGQGAGTGTISIHYTPRTISADGSRIFFTDNSATGDTSGTLYARVDGTTTVQINASERSVPDPPQPATYWTASSDGTRVFFTTSERLTDDDTDGSSDVYMWDGNAPAGHHLTRISADHESADAPNGAEGVIGTSDDGHYVYFVVSGQLVSDQPVLTGGYGFYEWHDGTTSYIGRMASPGADLKLDLPNTWNLAPLGSRVSSDGKHVLFASHSGVGLTGYDQGECTGGCAELYVYDAVTHALQCASCNPTGALATTSASITVRGGTGASDTSWHLNHAMSDDGRRVFFNTAEALAPQDADGKVDTYEYDVSTGTVHLLSGGTDTGDSYFLDASASGNDAFFITRQQLVGWDNDQNYDLYDARVDGGLPEPAQSPPGCVGDACQGDLGGNPADSSPASSTFAGRGNASSRSASHKKPKPKPLRCKRGYVKKKVKGRARCVKKRTKRRAQRAAAHKPAIRRHHTHGRTK